MIAAPSSKAMPLILAAVLLGPSAWEPGKTSAWRLSGKVLARRPLTTLGGLFVFVVDRSADRNGESLSLFLDHCLPDSATSPVSFAISSIYSKTWCREFSDQGVVLWHRTCPLLEPSTPLEPQLVAKTHAVLSCRRWVSDLDGPHRQAQLSTTVVDANAKTNRIDEDFGGLHIVLGFIILGLILPAVWA
jgi:hypothetical protein